MKKFTTMAICFVLIACMVAGGSLAYLTDRDSVANVFTVGDVRIELTEDFAQGATLTPGVDIKKEPTIKNTGINDAWVWAQIAFPSALDNDDASKNVVHFNYEADYVNATEWTWKDANNDWMVQENVDIKNDGKLYNIYTVLYQTALERGQETKPVMTNVYMDTNVDIDNEGNWNIVEKGVVTPLDWNTNEDGAPIIYVSAYAVQAEGFTTVQEAYAAYNEQWTTDAGVNNGLEWADAKVADVEDDAALEEALKADATNIVVTLNADVTYDVAAWQNDAMGGEKTKSIVINGNGHTITFNQTNSDWNNIVTNGAKLVINDATITNAGHNNGPWNRHDLNFACDVELNNVISDKAFAFKAGAALRNVTINDANTSDTYAIWIQPKGQTVTLEKVTIDMLDCTDGRGIKIDNQYMNAEDEAKVILNVKDTVFKTEEKSAILVKSTVGADITLDNVNITEVAADSTNAVWVDEATEDYADLVTVTGGSVIVEP